jgi:predicted dehydrogenase/threonine dehydrogenase-like Zn-dependent dehydrogenase
MKQVLQNLSSGDTEIVSAPAPSVRVGHVLIDTSLTLVSAGTERMLVDFGRANLLSKVRQQPDKVRQVLDKVRTDGVAATFEAVGAKLGQPIPLGYCNVGVVREAMATGFAPGDRVVSNGPHAEVVCVPGNLCAKIPDGVDDEAAAFVVLAAIGLQGIRLAAPTLGEAFAVTGVGLIGLLTVQLLRAQGCRVLAIDLDDEKLALAARYGAETCNSSRSDPVAAGMAFSRGRGMDGVLITAATDSDAPVRHAAGMSRKRGRIVLTGVAGLKLNRADFYEKELSFQVSCSYGPGRYDPAYEAGGQDYPVGFVRWTEQRNFEAILDMMAAGALDTSALISHRFEIDAAAEAYALLASGAASSGIVIAYPAPVEARAARSVALRPPSEPARATLAMIGAGNYASRVLIPAFRDAGARMHSLVSAGGASAAIHGRRNDFEIAATSADEALADPDVSVVAIATRHDSHARLAAQALNAGRHVFVEKPLALTLDELAEVEHAHGGSGRLLMVGFNRRFAPHTQAIKRALDDVKEPKSFVMMLNAGAIPADHWTQDPQIGGGRIIGEACHHIDLMRFLADSPIVSVQARRMGGAGMVGDKAAIMLGFADGSFGTVHYLANGGAAFPKERVEVFAGGGTLQIDNWKRLRAFNWNGVRDDRLWRQNKGQTACVRAFVEAVECGSGAPIPADELFEVARVSIEAAQLLAAQRG